MMHLFKSSLLMRSTIVYGILYNTISDPVWFYWSLDLLSLHLLLVIRVVKVVVTTLTPGSNNQPLGRVGGGFLGV